MLSMYGEMTAKLLAEARNKESWGEIPSVGKVCDTNDRQWVDRASVQIYVSVSKRKCVHLRACKDSE